MNFETCIRELDKLEEKRKADYSIWGYLYQFDLAFYDMLCQCGGENLFDRTISIENPIYELETIEDYNKYYKFGDKNYIDLAQVKYSSSSREFTHWDVLRGLYYNYLYIKNNTDEEVDIRCSIFFSTPVKIDIDKKEILNVGIGSIKEYIKTFDEVAVSSSQKEINELGNFEERIGFIYSRYHTEEELVNFLTNNIVIKWFENKDKIREKIKDKLMNMFGDNFQEIDVKKRKDVLYSLGINFIIHEWQSKKKRKEIKKISIDNVRNYYNDFTANRENIFKNLFSNYIRNSIEGVLSQIERSLIREEYSELEAEIIINKNFSRNADRIYEYLSEILFDRHNRYKLLNTIMLTPIITKEEYFELNDMQEFEQVITSAVYFKSYIQRLLKVMHFNDCNQLKEDNLLTNLISVENDMFLIKSSLENRKCLLLPKSYPDVIDNHEVIFDRIMKSKLRPTVWYFDNGIQSNGKYDFMFNKIDESDVNISRPYSNRYYIECMKCLKENEFLNICDMNCIFKERCKKDGNTKY